VLTTFLVTATLSLLGATAAPPLTVALAPDGACPIVDVLRGNCVVGVAPGDDDAGIPVSDNGTPSSHIVTITTFTGATVTCVLGPPVRPRNPADPAWMGHWPDGDLYQCMERPSGLPNGNPGGAAAGITWHVWLASAPAIVNPEDLARQAVADMGLMAPQIATTGYGQPGATRTQLLGLPTWMWVANPADNTTGPISRTVSQGGISVSATATLSNTVWIMGDGGQVTCSGANAAGTAYYAAAGDAPSPMCGYRYNRTSAGMPDRAFTVQATANWAISWSGGGQSGTLTASRASTIPLRVGENQVIITQPQGR
jgi:hypothetical protein